MSQQLVAQIAAAVNLASLYPPNHPRVAAAVESLVAVLERALRDRNSDSVTFLIVGDDLVIEHEVIRNTTLSDRQFVGLLKRRGIERLTLGAGADAAELFRLVRSLATGEDVASSECVILGRVVVGVDDKRDSDSAEALTSDQLDLVKEAFTRFRDGRSMPIAPLEQLVWNFIDALSRSTRSILPLGKLKDHDEYTFIHSVNVALLVLGQARSFGISGTTLHSFGMAGMLHDIGKLTVPLEILNKPGRLEGEEWRIMQGHAERGAWHLSEIEGASPLSILVAYEHHFRYDGEPAYPSPSVPRRPTLASQMTSIADAYDAMSTVRPYQQPLMRPAALEVLQKRASTFYDPMLVAGFTRLVREMGSPV